MILFQDWHDERLKWNQDEIPLKDVVVEAKKLWRPEFASINGQVNYKYITAI